MAYVPDELVEQSNTLTPTALRLALYYCAHANRNGRCWPSEVSASEALKVRLDNLKNYDDELVSKGWVSISKEQQNRRLVSILRGYPRPKKSSLNLGESPQNLGSPSLNLGESPQNLGSPSLNLGESPQNLGSPSLNLGESPQNLGSHIRNHEPAHEPAHEPVLAAAAPRAKKVEIVNPQKIASQGVVFEAMAKLCQVDWRNCSARVAKQLGAAYERYRGMFPGKPDSALIAGLDAFSAWWYSQDWRGKRNQPPEPVQVVDLWPRFRTWFKSGKSDLGGTQSSGRRKKTESILGNIGDE